MRPCAGRNFDGFFGIDRLKVCDWQQPDAVPASLLASDSENDGARSVLGTFLSSLNMLSVP